MHVLWTLYTAYSLTTTSQDKDSGIKKIAFTEEIICQVATAE